MKLSAGLEESFASDGFLTLNGIFDRRLIDASYCEFQRQFLGRSVELGDQLQVGNRRIQLPIEIAGAIADPMLLSHPLLLTIIQRLLGRDPVLDSVSCVIALPGAKVQRVHRDYPRLGLSPPFAVTVAIPLIDLSELTGSTFVYRGSHVCDHLPEGQATLPAAAYPGRGDCFLMDYSLWHQGAPNQSDCPRPILYLVYARPWFTDDRNFRSHARMNVAKNTLMGMPLEQKRLFRRLAAKGGYDLTETELVGEGGDRLSERS